MRSSALKGKKTVLRLLIVCTLVVLCAACTAGRVYKRPEVKMPRQWCIAYPVAAGVANVRWWELFHDPVLNNLIDVALKKNKDVRIATARVQEFAGRFQSVQSALYPSLDYGIGAGREQQSLERNIPSLSLGPDRRQSSYRFQAAVNWEVDIWGRLRKKREAARADLLASEYARDAVILTLTADVAEGYMSLLSLDRMLDTARRTYASREEFLRLFEDKFRGGQVSDMELAQVRSAFESVAETVPDIELQIALQEDALSVLLGRNPGKIRRGKGIGMSIMPEIPQGLPADLLERRPDIRMSEENLVAADAMIDVVRDEYYPEISLTGLFGYASTALSEFLRDTANYWSAGLDVAGPIFSAGRIKGDIQRAEAQRVELLNEYLRTIQTALQEVNDSLFKIRKLQEKLKIQERHIKALKDYLHFARERYDAQYVSYIDVLDAERNLYSTEIANIKTKKALFIAFVECYKSMGGGWGSANKDGERNLPSRAVQVPPATDHRH
ncbi:MAG: efflux transporter outer membrane subunit [Deltaproteobacteria bacterium]|nr:efflux transporter outer membrane subunit [Deltaproteobacteria bacterium]